MNALLAQCRIVMDMLRLEPAAFLENDAHTQEQHGNSNY